RLHLRPAAARAPPLIPNTGPSDGSRRQTAVRTPRRRRPSARPTLTVVLPSPALVGVTALTSTSLPGAAFGPGPASARAPRRSPASLPSPAPSPAPSSAPERAPAP